MEELRELPNGWLWVSVGNVYSIVGGGTPSTSIPEYWQGEIPWITSADIYGLKDIRPRRFINNKAIDNSTTNLVPEGSLIIVTRVGLGKMAIANKPICFSQDLQALICNNSYIFPEYAMYCLSQVIQIFKYKNRGTTIAGVTKKQLSNLMFPLPPLPEQHSIVAKIEELFTNLEAGIESLKKTKAQLKRYRQAVLKHAFEGKLTEEWREANKEKLEPASILLDRIMQERETGIQAGRRKGGKGSSTDKAKTDTPSTNLPEGWQWVELGEIANKITDGEHFRPKTVNNGVYFLSAKDIRDNGVSFEAPLFISEETANKASQRCNPERGDILIVSRGATIGRLCIVNTNKKFCLLGSVILIKVNKNIDNAYLAHILKSPFIKQKMISISGATAQQAIYLRDIQNIPIPLCNYSEQQTIVKEIESYLSVVDKLEEIIEHSLIQSERMRQGILKRAFEGKLVPQDPK